MVEKADAAMDEAQVHRAVSSDLPSVKLTNSLRLSYKDLQVMYDIFTEVHVLMLFFEYERFCLMEIHQQFLLLRNKNNNYWTPCVYLIHNRYVTQYTSERRMKIYQMIPE